MRGDQGYWQQIEKFVHEHSRANLSHGICPDGAVLPNPGFCEKE
jgi:hypothetical protein